MALDTHSAFYFDYEVGTSSFTLDFSEGGGEIQADVEIGSYTLTEVATAVAAALNDNGGQEYTASVDRTTRKITISAPGTFELLVSSGSRAGTSVYPVIGFTGADRTGSTSYEGDAAGQEYTTQFKLQDYVSSDNEQQSASASVNVATSGEVEVITFGQEKFITASFRFVTNRDLSGSKVFRNRADGLDQFRNFMQFLITKAPIEFMPSEDDRATFEKVLLERTPSNGDGVGYRLEERVSDNLPGFFDLGPVRFRVLE